MISGNLLPSEIRLKLTRSNLEYQWSYYEQLLDIVISDRPDDVVEQNNFLHHLFLLADLITNQEDPPPRNAIPTLKVVDIELSLLIPEWLGFMLNNFLGAYPAAARTLRWIFESAVASASSQIDGSIFEKVQKGEPLTAAMFRSWLMRYDNRQASLPRPNALKVLELSTAERAKTNKLYADLCKFTHVSARYYRRLRIPDLVLDWKYFDLISKYATRTMDLALYCIITAMSSQWDISPFLGSYADWFSPNHMDALRKDKFPLTMRAINNP
jgi:hypothetical protein